MQRRQFLLAAATVTAADLQAEPPSGPTNSLKLKVDVVGQLVEAADALSKVVQGIDKYIDERTARKDAIGKTRELEDLRKWVGDFSLYVTGSFVNGSEPFAEFLEAYLREPSQEAWKMGEVAALDIIYYSDSLLRRLESAPILLRLELETAQLVRAIAKRKRIVKSLVDTARPTSKKELSELRKFLNVWTGLRYMTQQLLDKMLVFAKSKGP